MFSEYQRRVLDFVADCMLWSADFRFGNAARCTSRRYTLTVTKIYISEVRTADGIPFLPALHCTHQRDIVEFGDYGLFNTMDF
jgi:hypothetical protein